MEHLDQEIIAAYVDGMLDDDGVDAVIMHMLDCERCRALITETQAFLASEAQSDNPSNS